MTTTETPNPYVTPVTTPVTRDSALASAVGLFLGGYILVQSLNGQLASALSGFGAVEVLPLFVGQLLFALAAVIFSIFLAPATASLKFIASAIVLVGAIVTVAMQAGRLTTGCGGVPMSITFANPYFMVALTLGIAWLILRSARVGWLSLLLTIVLIPLPFIFSMNAVSVVISQPVQLVVLGIVGAVILVAGRPRGAVPPVAAV